MTATDELREGLRKRGESWHKWPDDYSTTWQAYSNPHTATESMDGTLIVTGLTTEQAIAATLGCGTCREVYLLMATDIGDGREEVLGVYATEEAAIAAINENQFGYALHHVRKWEVDE